VFGLMVKVDSSAVPSNRVNTSGESTLQISASLAPSITDHLKVLVVYGLLYFATASASGALASSCTMAPQARVKGTGLVSPSKVMVVGGSDGCMGQPSSCTKVGTSTMAPLPWSQPSTSVTSKTTWG
jgi:hypothetical protein